MRARGAKALLLLRARKPGERGQTSSTADRRGKRSKEITFSSCPTPAEQANIHPTRQMQEFGEEFFFSCQERSYQAPLLRGTLGSSPHLQIRPGAAERIAGWPGRRSPPRAARDAPYTRWEGGGGSLKSPRSSQSFAPRPLAQPCPPRGSPARSRARPDSGAPRTPPGRAAAWPRPSSSWPRPPHATAVSPFLFFLLLPLLPLPGAGRPRPSAAQLRLPAHLRRPPRPAPALIARRGCAGSPGGRGGGGRAAGRGHGRHRAPPARPPARSAGAQHLPGPARRAESPAGNSDGLPERGPSREAASGTGPGERFWEQLLGAPWSRCHLYRALFSCPGIHPGNSPGRKEEPTCSIGGWMPVGCRLN